MDSKGSNENNVKIGLPSTGKNSKSMKMLSENKLKRLNILTFINENKEILFTKKAYKFEKEKIWRQIFEMMRDSGMVSAEKDWRYVRDVSFSNWRKRAQKRLKHLNANGYRLNMDECEFLISDILGHTPERPTLNGRQKMQNIEEEMEEEESDEYMIDSDEEDDTMFDEMLLIPKVVINDIDGQIPDSNKEESKILNNILTRPKNPLPANSTSNNKRIQSSNPMILNNQCKMLNINSKLNGPTNATQMNGKIIPVKNLNSIEPNCGNVKPIAVNSETNNVGNKRLLELEIENKILKNRYMKLKIFKLEKNLGFDHCNEVRELINLKSISLK